MGDHYRADAGVDGLSKGNELCLFETRKRMIDDRQAAMRIDICVAMSGEMLCSRQNALALQTFHKCDAKLCHCLRVLAIRPNIYDGIVRIIVNVEDRREYVLDAHRLCLATRDDADLVRVRGIT